MDRLAKNDKEDSEQMPKKATKKTKTETTSETKECKPGSRFVKPTYNAAENIIFFGGPSQGKDAIYIYVKGAKEAKIVTQVEDCVTDIAVSPKGFRLAYQTSKTISTLTEGYATDLYVVQADGLNSQQLATAGKLPKESLSEGTTLDIGPAEVVWPSEDVFYMKGFFLGKETGIWRYDVTKNAFTAVTNLKGGP
jgi:dipeptidyl aminopeptidase/acylaminoacyl peptidase